MAMAIGGDMAGFDETGRVAEDQEMNIEWSELPTPPLQINVAAKV